MSFEAGELHFTQNGKALTDQELSYEQAQKLNVYPTPFSGSAHIDLNLERGGEVYLELYDLTGKMVEA
jgi:hypothetical protein